MTLNIANRKDAQFYRAMLRGRHYVKLAYRRLSPFGERRPVFILGSGRSGTNIVSHCLGRARDVELINEDNPKAFENWQLKRLDVVGRAVDSSRARLVMFKPFVETLRANEFLARFPSSLVVFVVRNPFDAINSMARFFGESHVRAEKNWVETDFERQPQAPTALRSLSQSIVMPNYPSKMPLAFTGCAPTVLTFFLICALTIELPCCSMRTWCRCLERQWRAFAAFWY